MREYHPSWVEILISAGIFSFGLFVLTLLIKVALPVELGLARASRHDPAPGAKA
jgi:Ni/Fe-hydrogenase subunit HybB-like protein